MVRMLSGERILLFNVGVQERRDGVLIDTPLGKLFSPEKALTVLPLTGCTPTGSGAPSAS